MKRLAILLVLFTSLLLAAAGERSLADTERHPGAGLDPGALPDAGGAGRRWSIPLVLGGRADGPSEGRCPATSENRYQGGIAYQYDRDNPVRPAQEHADKNLALRGYERNTDANLLRFVDYGVDDPNQPPQFATLFSPQRVPALCNSYRVSSWVWAPSPAPGYRGGLIGSYPVTALGLASVPGEVLHVPISGYDIGGGMEVLVIFADEDSVAMRYTREDSSGSQGYTVHIDGICTDPNLLALYRALDAPGGARYVYRPGGSYTLPNLRAGQPLGVARGSEIVVAITDTGSFSDPRSLNEWWQVRPGLS